MIFYTFDDESAAPADSGEAIVQPPAENEAEDEESV